MDQSVLTHRLTQIESELPKLANTVSAMKVTDTRTYGQNYEELSLDAALRAERIACSLRNLIYAANLLPKQTLMDKVCQVHGIRMNHTSEFVEIVLPGLLPKRTGRINTRFLTDPLYTHLAACKLEHQMPHFTECVVCFTHVYDRALPARWIRDYDNMECKQLLDTAAGFLMNDDNGLYCDAYHTTELGEKDCTVLTIMEKSYFSVWLHTREERMKSISDF